MSREKHLEKINEVLDNMKAELLYEAARLLNSGGIDPDQFNDEEYILARIVAIAAINREAQTLVCGAIKPEYKKLIKNLIRM